ncbi:DUF998 domain-containing protein [Kibdelosporangium persicum]|uniref:DUF998 domain-containing protein n=1 Tax=Kibdelosporangium persicum TaxID=2698649 RepID=A0ABX2F1J2_9PSEU|nr:DUF998 domain-containing protein [Kibdelosporangium persicum]NRN65196.1 hypothetical protein [Kibdelosporangium persicum]
MTIVSPPRGDAARTQPWLIVSAGAICWGALAFVVLHLVSGRDPLRDAVSLYAFTDQAPGLLAVSILWVAFGSVTTVGALAAAGVPLSRTTKVLFGLWSGGLALAAVFPVSYGQLSSLVSGEIHQYACVAAFLSVPAIGLSLAAGTRGIPALARDRATVLRWTRYSMAGLVLFAVSYLLDKSAGVPLGTILPVGLTQRITLVIDIGLLCAVIRLAYGASASSRTARPITAAPGYADLSPGR